MLFFNILIWAIILPPLLSLLPLDELLKRLTPARVVRRHRTRRVVVFTNWWLNRNMLMLRPTCLNRSLLLYRFLTRDGLDVRIHYGLRKTENGMEGHSWLSLGGKPLLNDGLTATDYEETFVFPVEVKAG